MTYKLTADLDDMGRNEARALVAAILERFGSEIVDEEIKRRVAKKERVDRLEKALLNQRIDTVDQSEDRQLGIGIYGECK